MKHIHTYKLSAGKPMEKFGGIHTTLLVVTISMGSIKKEGIGEGDNQRVFILQYDL